LQDLRKGLNELREGLKRIRQELAEHFADLDDQDMYGKQMWSFVGKANEQVEDLVHDVNNAESTFVDAITYYGEDEKNMTSSEYYGIFKTFVTSYKKCKVENQAFAEQKAAYERRKQLLEENRAQRQRVQETDTTEKEDVLDALLEKLRRGDAIGRRSRRTRESGEQGAAEARDDPANIARDMLAQLQSEGFIASGPPSPTSTRGTSRRRRRRRRGEEEGSDVPGI